MNVEKTSFEHLTLYSQFIRPPQKINKFVENFQESERFLLTQQFLFDCQITAKL